MKRLILVAVIAFLAACSSTTATSLSPQEFQSLTQQPGVEVIDVRTPEEFAQGHLANAVNMNVESPEFATQIASLDPNGEYAIYCRSANRSKVAMEQMKAAGITNVQELDGGIVAWQAQGLPLS